MGESGWLVSCRRRYVQVRRGLEVLERIDHSAAVLRIRADTERSLNVCDLSNRAVVHIQFEKIGVRALAAGEQYVTAVGCPHRVRDAALEVAG